MPSLLDNPAFIEACKPKTLTKTIKTTKPRRKERPEAKIQDNIVAYLLGRGWLVIRVNSLNRPSANGGRVTAYIAYWVSKATGKKQSTSAGINDVLAIKGANGTATALFIEIKTPEEARRPSHGLRDSQQLFQRILGDHDVNYHIASSVDDVQKILSDLEVSVP